MGRLQDIKRINRGDFPDEYKELIEGLSTILNTFMEDVLNNMNKSIDHENLKREIKEIDVIVINTTTGALKTNVSFKNGLSRLKGINVIKVDNLTDSTQPTSLPLVNFSENAGQVNVLSVIGLPINKKFRLRIETIA